VTLRMLEQTLYGLVNAVYYSSVYVHSSLTYKSSTHLFFLNNTISSKNTAPLSELTPYTQPIDQPPV